MKWLIKKIFSWIANFFIASVFAGVFVLLSSVILFFIGVFLFGWDNTMNVVMDAYNLLIKYWKFVLVGYAIIVISIMTDDGKSSNCNSASNKTRVSTSDGFMRGYAFGNSSF